MREWSSINPASPGDAAAESSSLETAIDRESLLEIHNKFRALRHSACNALAVVMALSEMAERNPAYMEKLTQTVMAKSPQIVSDLKTFDEEFRALLKARPE